MNSQQVIPVQTIVDDYIYSPGAYFAISYWTGVVYKKRKTFSTKEVTKGKFETEKEALRWAEKKSKRLNKERTTGKTNV